MSTVVTESGFDELCHWLQKKAKQENPIPLDLNLVEKKIVDSLVFVEFMMLLEEISGETIEVNEELLGKVYSLQVIKNNFFANE